MARTKNFAGVRITRNQVTQRREKQAEAAHDGTKDYLLVFHRVHLRKDSDDVVNTDIILLGGRCKTKLEAVSQADKKMDELEGQHIVSGNVLLSDNRDAPPDNGVLFREEHAEGGFCELLIFSTSKEGEEEPPIHLSQQITTEEGVKKRFAQAAEAVEIPNVTYKVQYRTGYWTCFFRGIIFRDEKDIGLYSTMGAAIENGSAAFFHYRELRFADNRIISQNNGLLLRAEDSDGRVHEVLISTKPVNTNVLSDDICGVDTPAEPPSKKART